LTKCFVYRMCCSSDLFECLMHISFTSRLLLTGFSSQYAWCMINYVYVYAIHKMSMAKNSYSFSSERFCIKPFANYFTIVASYIINSTKFDQFKSCISRNVKLCIVILCHVETVCWLEFSSLAVGIN